MPSHDVHHAVEHAANDLAETVKIPGFRKGKVPMPVLISRVGKDRLYTEAVESHIAGWFWNAAARARLRPVAQPEYDFELPANDADPWQFTATVEVMPKPELPDWSELEVPYAEPEVPEGLVDHELEVLRSSVAELTPVEGRGAQAGDTVVIDLVSPGGETQHDYVVQLGAGRLVEEIEQGVLGMEAGESKEIGFELADESTGTVEVQLKEIKEHVLPPLDDELARTASEFDTLDELRADLEQRLQEQVEAEADAAFRSAVIDALVAGGERPGERAARRVARARAPERARPLGRGPRDSLRGLPADDRRLRRRARAARPRRGGALRRARGHARGRRRQARAHGRGRRGRRARARAGRGRGRGRRRGDRRAPRARRVRAPPRGPAPARLARPRSPPRCKRIPVELAEAREAIWTPEKEKQATETKLWTPGSKE